MRVSVLGLFIVLSHGSIVGANCSYRNLRSQ